MNSTAVLDSPNCFATLLPEPDDILVDVCINNGKQELFEQAATLFEKRHGLSRQTVLDSLTAREKLGSTGLGHGIAIPHGRVDKLKDPIGAFIRLSTPISFDAPDGQPITLAFILLVPMHATEQHLDILSKLAECFCEKTFREKVSSSPDAPAIHQIFMNH